MSHALERRTLGRSQIEVSSLGIGTSPLAGMPELYGYDVGTDTAVDTVLAVFDSAITFLDTSNGYGADGASEKRVGEAIRRAGGLPEGFVLQTKVDPDPVTHDFSGARVRASFAESLERLGLRRLELLALHDPEFMAQDPFAVGGAVEALIALRDEGHVDHLAVAGGSVRVMGEFLAIGEFDVLLNHSRFTLLDRSAEPLFVLARESRIGVINAAPYGGGMLSKGPDEQSKYGYGDRDAAIAESARAMQTACARHGVPLAAAALQFSARSPLIDTTVVGLSSRKRVTQTLELLAVDVPDELWDELERLVPPREGWLD